MMETMVALLVCVLVIAPLACRIWLDRIETRALNLRAGIHAAVVHALGGESLVAVYLSPPLPWRNGRVILSAAAGSESLMWPVWRAVLAKDGVGGSVARANDAAPAIGGPCYGLDGSKRPSGWEDLA